MKKLLFLVVMVPILLLAIGCGSDTYYKTDDVGGIGYGYLEDEDSFTVEYYTSSLCEKIGPKNLNQANCYVNFVQFHYSPHDYGETNGSVIVRPLPTEGWDRTDGHFYGTEPDKEYKIEVRYSNSETETHTMQWSAKEIRENKTFEFPVSEGLGDITITASN